MMSDDDVRYVLGDLRRPNRQRLRQVERGGAGEPAPTDAATPGGIWRRRNRLSPILPPGTAAIERDQGAITVALYIVPMIASKIDHMRTAGLMAVMSP